MTETQVFWLIVGVLWTVSELFISIYSRKQPVLEAQLELRSERLIWLVVCLSLLFALIIKNFQYLTIEWPAMVKLYMGLTLLIFGLILRIYAVFCLGIFFTTQVGIQVRHRLINKGPYRYIRHPSYTGLIIGFFGAGIAMGDYLSLLSLIIPLTYILIKRIAIEEVMLQKCFGKEYESYRHKTKKLIPAVY